MQIDKVLYNEINAYCKENKLNTRAFIHKLLKEAFMKEKYGEAPFFFQNNTFVNELDANNTLNSPIQTITHEEIKEKYIAELPETPKEEKDITTDNIQTPIKQPKKKRRLA